MPNTAIPIQTPFQKAEFVGKDGRLSPKALQLIQQLVTYTQGDSPTSGTIKLGPVMIHYGSGAPNGSVVGSPPDAYFRLDGGAGTCLYIKESGVNTNTGWVAK